jgi:ribosome-associated protein
VKKPQGKDNSADIRDLAKKIAEFTFDTKAEEIILLDMREVVNFCDYFIICSATSERHAASIADNVDKELIALGTKVRFKKGSKSSSWIVFDAGDIVVHIFHKDVREFYKLEYLWQEAEKVEWQKTKK